MQNRATTPATSERDHSARMIGFALKWYRHGGGSDESIREQFDVEPVRYFTDLLWQLTVEPPAPVRPSVLDKIGSVTRRRLWLASLDVLDDDRRCESSGPVTGSGV